MVPQLTNVKDLSTDDVRIALELRPGSNAEAALAYLFKNTPLQTNFNVNLTCLLPAAGAEVAVPDRLDLKSMLLHFLDFRLEVVTRRLRHELENLLQRIHILEGFAIVFNNLDEAIRIIRASDGKADAAPKLIARFGLSRGAGRRDPRDEALPARASSRSRDILDELAKKRQAGRGDPGAARRRAGAVGDHPGRAQARSPAPTATPRRTRIEGPPAPVEYREEDYIVDEDAWVIVTRDGWTKRQKSFTDVASIRVRDDDRVGWVYRARARQTLTFFTDRGIGLHAPGQRPPADHRARRADPEAVRLRGPASTSSASSATTRAACPTVVDVPQTPPVLVQATLNGELGPGDRQRRRRRRLPAPAPYAIAMTAGGKVLRFALAPLAVVSTRKGRSVVRLDPVVTDDLVVGVEATDGTETVCLATRSARVLIFPVAEANVVSGLAKGVTAIKLDPKDRVLGFASPTRCARG